VRRDAAMNSPVKSRTGAKGFIRDADASRAWCRTQETISNECSDLQPKELCCRSDVLAGVVAMRVCPDAGAR
jgi:hypothetical protein